MVESDFPRSEEISGPGSSNSTRQIEILRSVVANAPDGLIVADRDGRLLFFNGTAERILGIESTDLDPDHWSRSYGFFLADRVTPYPAERLPLTRALRGEEVNSEQLFLRNEARPSGAWLTIDGKPLRSDGGAVTGAVLVLRDETAPRKIKAMVRRLFAALSQTADSVMITDARGRIEYVNPAFEQTTGYAREEVLGRTPSLLRSGHHGPEFYEEMWRTILAGRNFRATFLNRRKNGELYWSEQTITPLKDEHGAVSNFVSVLKDVTERERALHKERDFSSAIFASAGALLVVLDRKGRIVRFNKACEQLTGLGFEEARGEPMWSERLMPAEDAGKFKSLLAELLAGGSRCETECHLLTASGEKRDTIWWHTALVGEDGEIEHIVCTGVDVSRRRRAEAALQESEKMYRKIVESLHEGIWILDEDAYTTFVNERMAKMLGYEAEEMAGRHVFTFMDERGVEECKQRLERRRQGIEEDYEFELITKDGQRVDTIIQGSPIFDDEGRYRGALAGVLDNSERKRTTEELRKAHSELEQRVEERTRDLRVALEEVDHLKNRLEAENIYLREEIKINHDFEEIVGESAALRKALHRVDQVAGTDATVLILGETGTGKELVARAIHNRSPRKERPLVKVNCAALPAPLIESELFGHEKGAFTGADRQRSGRFEVADGGTIFLDEIGDLPMELQIKLLRVLQEGEYERVGSTRPRSVDVRVIAATNRNLKRAVREEKFRADLYYRLGVFPITLPPLRDRREDVPSLVWHFVRKNRHRRQDPIESVSQMVMTMLQDYDWPGNVRELENVVERAMILSPSTTLVLDEGFGAVTPRPGFPAPARELSMMEKAHITQVLEECRWKIKGRGNAADRLGLKPSTLRDRMKRLGIERPR